MRRLVIASTLVLVMIAACKDATAPRGPGSIFITSSVPSLEPTNFFQYSITVDKGTPRRILSFVADTLMLNGLAHGAHVVELTGLPTGCSTEAPKRELTLVGDDTARVPFSIACLRRTGDIRVTVTTTGQDQDQNGYLVRLNSVPVAPVPANGETTIQFVQPNTYSASLTDVAENCTPTAASQSVTVIAGVLSTVSLSVTCSAVANVKMVVNASGADPDPDGVTLKLGSGTAMRTAMGTSHVRVAPGSQTWQLGDVQPNCTLTGASTGSFTVAAGDTVTVDASMTCTAVGYGTATTVATDAAGDTLANGSNNANQAHDVAQVTTRYTPNWLILVMRFTRPVGIVGSDAAAGLQGYIELDTDDNAGTGSEPIINSFGGNATQGVEYGLLLFEATNTSVYLAKSSGNDTTTHRVPLAIEGDSVMIRIPLAKVGGDDGNMSITAVLGTFDRPTDVAPNSGVILARQPTSPVIAGAASPASSERAVPKARANDTRAYFPKWQQNQ